MKRGKDIQCGHSRKTMWGHGKKVAICKPEREAFFSRGKPVIQFDLGIQFSSVQLLSCDQLFVTPWIAARQASLSITNFRSLLKLMSIESVMPSNHLSVILFSSHPQSLLASGSFPRSQLFAWGGQSIRVSASASVLPVNTQDWSPLRWTGWISLQSKGLSKVFSNTTVQKHPFFGAQLSSQYNSHIHTWPLDLGIAPSRNEKILVWFKPPSLWCFILASLTG